MAGGVVFRPVSACLGRPTRLGDTERYLADKGVHTRDRPPKSSGQGRCSKFFDQRGCVRTWSRVVRSRKGRWVGYVRLSITTTYETGGSRRRSGSDWGGCVVARANRGVKKTPRKPLGVVLPRRLKDDQSSVDGVRQVVFTSGPVVSAIH